MTFLGNFNTEILIYLLDMIGIIACAIAATTLAMYKRFDLFGGILVSMVNAIGGGTIRDVMLGRHPLFWMTDLTYVVVITITSILCQMFFHRHQHIDGALKFFDAIGLAAFSVIGLTVALSFDAHPLIAVMMAVMTSIAGGIMRDMICNEIPLVLQKEIYISASIIGSVLYLVLDHLTVADWIKQSLTLTTIFGVRMMALRFDWHLPSIQLNKDK
ncbi:trimeric intracellular cation channel family protein [Moraxella catarrhalis]|uniref:YadS protein n=1 Tax=Moraxella catarrhalis TaxID=480 RepID=A0A198UG71_MORCA|nr:trimeric intracellular cation channel family protein [Moraxella catarrhalis]OAU94114.1 yadS protein [Moraxella catarrhalis]OAU94202.1 yadS protein [Moraxella catarrhalis]OAU99699.1 yadS protein [Moraxella catarrhalis]